MALEDLSQLNNGEPNGFSLNHGEAILKNIACLHAKFWNKAESNITKGIWMHGGYWFGPKEMPHSVSVQRAFSQTLCNFGEHLNLGLTQQIQDLGKKLEHLTSYITYQVHHTAPKTVIHGDYKISNLFIEEEDVKVFAIDWQWCGIGCCATDVAYLVYTSLLSGIITNPIELNKSDPYDYYSPNELQLLQTYHSTLLNCGVTNYSFELFEQQYLINVLYFCIFCIRQKYSKMTVQDVHNYQKKNRDGLHLRYFSHIKQIIERASTLVDHVHKDVLKPALSEGVQKYYFNYAPKFDDTE